ncbi:hypothetical protein SPRG_17687 [Saprolegnia parasitica CBS 223.65]|uniref:TIGR00299 family protein n=1 Tax=Saprolegnia parasitica (strain CBS 223.65) TaxID=695850 RepID=A0A067BR92_SAPPC|nr:hypothetical protein SPRG_17687 [Saprolegnia parasitica CBS 223.65]KDO16831.1 hypothetical protein SPRG_17687 [Saprolegnia parasitica CBS 223.65]|eukprot:XP_012212463.1 hypothetical protein SPRG_17687 [Saprolegnia parasitica CBS 223.65]
MLDASGLSPWVREKSKDVFACLARAEARAHGASVDQVHFHEVGAIDSIIDTVGSVLALELLHVDEVHCSPLPYSNGFVKCMHGLMPVPVPATLDLMQGVPVIPAPKGQSTGELVTPTGMSLMKALATSFGPPPAFIPHTHGSGAGTKDFPGHANIVRVVIGDAAHPVSPSPTNDESVVVLETNLDDMNPQILSHVQELLFDQGALDVWWQPIQMKKNRPGILLSVLCLPGGVNALSTTLFCETTTLGIRRRTMERAVLKRLFMTVTSLYGPASVKVGYLNGAPVNVQPEFDDCQKLALAANVPIKTVLAEVQALARASLKKEAPVA